MVSGHGAEVVRWPTGAACKALLVRLSRDISFSTDTHEDIQRIVREQFCDGELFTATMVAHVPACPRTR